jgi:hypothetical protein
MYNGKTKEFVNSLFTGYEETSKLSDFKGQDEALDEAPP